MKEDLRQVLLGFFRNGRIASQDRFLAAVFYRWMVRKNAKAIAQKFSSGKKETNGPPIQIEVPVYKGSNPVALKISETLQQKVSSLLVSALVHGSVGTSEEISYSDFDGLLIISDDCIQNAESLSKLYHVMKETEAMMIDMDPLQHHGWFVLTESDLADYPEFYFPHALFPHAAVLFGQNKFNLHMQNGGYGNAFINSQQRLSNSILKKLSSGSYLENYYAYKNLLSEFMLLPAVTLQASRGEGVFKKFSFEKIKELVPDNDVMDSISEIRKSWSYKPPDDYAEKRRVNIQKGRRTNPSLSGVLPEAIKERFTNDLGLRMNAYVKSLQQ